MQGTTLTQKNLEKVLGFRAVVMACVGPVSLNLPLYQPLTHCGLPSATQMPGEQVAGLSQGPGSASRRGKRGRIWWGRHCGGELGNRERALHKGGQERGLADRLGKAAGL